MNESPSSPNQPTNSPSSDSGDPASESLAQKMAMEPIRAGGVLSPADYFRAMRMLGGRRQQLLVGVFLVAVFVIAVLVGETQAGDMSLRDQPYNAIGLTIVAITAVAGILAIFSIRRRLKIRSLWRKQRNPFRPLNLVVTDDGITRSTPDTTVSLRWSAFTAYECAEHMILLRQDPPTVASVVPRAFFANDADWARFLSIVDAKVPRKSRRSGDKGHLR
jgi:hypothetical protein